MARLLRRLAPWMAVFVTAGCDAPATIDSRPITHAGPEPGPAAAAAPMAAMAADAPLTVTRSPCESAGCKLIFTFSHPMVREPRKGRSRALSIAFEPEQPGRWEWTSATELVFWPGPSALPWGHDITVTVARARSLHGKTLDSPWQDSFRVPYFQAAGKVARWPVIDGRPRLVAFLNGRSDQIGAGPLYLLYDQPVDPGRVARSMRLSHGDKAVALAVSRPDSAGALAHVYSGELDTALIVAVRMKARALPEHGAEVTLQVPKLLDGAVPQIATRRFQVHTRFALEHMGPEHDQGADGRDRVPLHASFRLAFNSPVSAGAVKDAVRVTPEPRSLTVAWVWGSEAHVLAELDPGQTYEMKLVDSLEDELGNRLGKDHTLGFQAQDLEPRLDLPGEPMTLERGHDRVPVRVVNGRDVEARFQAVASPARFIELLRAGNSMNGACPRDPGAMSRRWSLDTAGDAPGDGASDAAGALNVSTTHQAELAIEDGLSGLGCVEIAAQGTGSQAQGKTLRAAIPVQVTDLGVTAKIHAGGIATWITRLSSAAPAAGATIWLVDEHGKTLSRATADGRGLAELDGKGITGRAGLTGRAYLIVDTADDRAVVTLDGARLSQPWQFGMHGDVKDVAALSAAVFTDRGVYRPDETVHLKIIARDPATGRTPLRGSVDVRVSDPRGKEIASKTLALDAYGGAHTDIALAKDAAVGRYAVQVNRGDHIAADSFLVEEYRVPTFHVDVTADGPWTAGQAGRATIEARYHHGGDMAARQVRYTVARERVAFSPAGFPGYIFGHSGDVDDSIRSADGVLSTGDTRLDGQGKLAVEVATAHPSTIGPMRYVIDASVTDVDRQVYRGRLERVIHPATVYVGVRPAPARILAAGDVLEVPVVAVSPAGQVQAGISATVELERVDYHTTARLATARLAGMSSVELKNRPVTRVVERCTVRTRSRPVMCKLRVPRAGQYRVLASSRDSKRALVQASFGFTASGEHTIAWPRFEHERIELIADQASYRPGDTARLMVQSPFAQASGLLTLERGGVLEHRPFVIDGDAPVLEVPITEAHAPNVYASVTLLQPRVHGQRDSTGFETGAPSFRMGYAELRVEPSTYALDVTVTSQTTAHPQSMLEIALVVRDRDNAPASGQATVMVVDEAVLAMTGYETPDPLAEIFRPGPLGVRTASSMLELPHSRRSRHEQIFVSGDGGPGFGLSALMPEMRNLFHSTAYWNPSVAIGADGRARLSIDLPDNVTTYRIMAVVTGAGARAGSGQARVVVRKPLMVQPVLPRFVHPGDTLRVEARVFNGTEREGKVTLDAVFTGMSGAGQGEKSAQGHDHDGAGKQASVAAGDAATMGFPVQVTGTDVVKARFVARMGAHSDAVEVSIPILNPGTRRRVIVSDSVTGTGELGIDLPAERVPGSAELEVLMSSTRLSQLGGAVEYLMGYPNGCIEQTTSRAYPLLVLQDLLPDMGVTVNPDELRTYAEAGVKRLLSFQTSSGGLAYWPGSDDAHAFGTAFGLTALIEAKKRGYDVPDDALARMAAYLQEALGRGAISEEMPHGGMADADTRALFVMTLGRLDRPQPGHVSSLWRARDKLTAFGLAFLAVAADELPGRDAALVEAMLAEVRARARVQAQEAFYDGDAQGGWSMGSPLRTHATALLAYAQSAPGHEMKHKLLAGLLARQQGGLWGNTQENVFGIMGVAAAIEHSASSGAGPRDADIELAIDGTAAQAMGATFEAMGAHGKRARIGASALATAVDDTPGKPARHTVRVVNRAATPAHVTVRAEYDVELTASTMAAQDHGFAIERGYERLDGRAVAPDAIALGELVRVRVRVSTKDKHNYVAIHDRLPAGLEPLNSNLATTESVHQGTISRALARGLQVLSYSEVRDERVAFYADDLPAGSYEFTYLARATTPGRFLRPAATAEAMYQPDASGSSSIDSVVIR